MSVDYCMLFFKASLTIAYLGFLRVFFLLLKPNRLDIIEAGPVHDVEGNNHNICVHTGQGNAST